MTLYIPFNIFADQEYQIPVYIVNHEDIKMELRDIIQKYPNAGNENLISILQDIQYAYGYLPENIIIEAAKMLRIPISKIYGVATFYNQFRFSPKGKYHIRICNGTACHISKANTLLTSLEKTLKIKEGQASSNNLFSYQEVDCMGACALSPIVSVNDDYYTQVNPESLKDIIESYRKMEIS